MPIILVLLGVQTHLSASVVIVLVVSVMMMVAGTRIAHFATFGAIGAGARSNTYVYTGKIF